MKLRDWRSWPWGLWTRQTFAVLRLELKKTLFTRRSWWIYLIALGPVFITGMHSLLSARGAWGRHPMGVDYRVYANIFQYYYLRLALFFCCAGIFATLFRGEVLEKTLHYYLLAPVRREVLMAGKYLAGVAAAILVFGGCTIASFYLIGAHYGSAHTDFLLRGAGRSQLFWYLVVAALACIGYGAVFTMAGLGLKNPMIPAVAVMIWEAINPFLPSVLQKISVIYYLRSLCPVDVPIDGPLALIAQVVEPAPASLAVPGILLVSLAVLIIAGRQAQKLQISYSE
jgi:ABC-type transport system involved in multi-copper enzyme maturation permease subunit